MLFKKAPYYGTDGTGTTRVDIPKSYGRTVAWIPSIGDTFVDFHAESTHGEMEFHAWARGHWTMFFGHPQAYSPVCATEIAEMAELQPEFDARSVRILGLTQSEPQVERTWIEDVERVFNVEVAFPVVSDAHNRLAVAFGMVHPNSFRPLPVRKTFIIDDLLRIRWISEYPNALGRNTLEVLRAIDAMQIADREGLYAPSGWKPGQTMLLRPTLSDHEADENYGDRWRRLNDYIRTAVPKG